MVPYDPYVCVGRRGFQQQPVRDVPGGALDGVALLQLAPWVADKTKEVMKAVGLVTWSPESFVNHLIAQTFPGQENSSAAKALAKTLVASLAF